MMGASRDVVARQIAELRDYTDTVAAVHLLKEVATNGAVVTVGAAKEIIAVENSKKEPKIGNVVKAILARAGKPGEDRNEWTDKEGKPHLEAAITIGGAVYTVDLTYDGIRGDKQEYTVNITSKLAADVERGKLFFNEGHTATVKLLYDEEGDLRAVTQKGLAVDTTSFVPYAYQNESLAKFCDSLQAGSAQRLAVMGTGSGKSIIMGGVAQAIGRTVMIVPDQTLVQQQMLETQKMLGAGEVHGTKHTPSVFTLETLKTQVDVADWEHLTEEEIQAVKEYFNKVITGTVDGENFDQVVLQAEHPLFKMIASEIKDSMVLIDESHRHTFNEEDVNILQGLKDRNSILALTATPTSKLYDIFPGDPVDDLSLGAAIELGTIRPVKPEVAYLEEGNLIDQAVLHYFDDYYLTEGMSGYADPVELKKQIMKEHSDMEDSEAEKMAIEQALKLNRIRAQRNMGFSDDKRTREELASVYQSLANGDRDTLEKYQDRVAALRQQSEFQARLQLAQAFNPDVEAEEVRRQTLPQAVDLKRDIDEAQRADIQRTINSFALALVLNGKFTDFAEKDRTHTLEDYLKECDIHIQKYKTGEQAQIPSLFLRKLQECEGKDRAKLNESLIKLGAPISKLPPEQRDIIAHLILDRAEAMVTNIKSSRPITELVTRPVPVDLIALKATENYAGAVDMSTEQSIIDAQLAQIEVGLRTHIVADQVIATGVSIRDILNVQIINTYSPVIEPDINAINGILSGPQAAGRCVRNKDVSARAQQYIDQRYEGKDLILTVHDIIDPKQSAVKAKAVAENRERQAQIETQQVTLIQRVVKSFQSARLRLFKELPVQVEKLEEGLRLAQVQLESIVESLGVKREALARLLQTEHPVVPERSDGEAIVDDVEKDIKIMEERQTTLVKTIEKGESLLQTMNAQARTGESLGGSGPRA